MSEDKKSLINLVPDSVDNAVKNITDKPTQNVGTTLADIWYLVFGGISQTAKKRKLKYSYDLQEFENELKEKISKIPKNKLIEPDIQVVARALEEAKYCIGKKELQKMFVALISSSLNLDINLNVHPLFVHTITSLNSIDAKLLFGMDYRFIISFDPPSVFASSFEVLYNLGLIKSHYFHAVRDKNKMIHKSINDYDFTNHNCINIIHTQYESNSWYIDDFYKQIDIKYPDFLFIEHAISLSEFGLLFKKICIDEADIKHETVESWIINGEIIKTYII